MRPALIEFTVVVCLLGCAERQPDCRPEPILTFPGSSSSTALPAVGRPSTEFTAPQLTCIPEDRTILWWRATVSGPTGELPVPMQFSPSTGERSKGILDLRAIPPGSYQARIFIEPTIALLSFPLVVPIDRRSATHSLRGPPPCQTTYRRTTFGTAVCELVSGTQLTQTDGGITTIPGKSSMVSGSVVWTEVDSPTSAFDTIERRVEEAPGRFRVTHTLQAPASGFGRRFADEQNWWRDTLWAAIDSNRTVLRNTPDSHQSIFRLIDDDRALEIRNEGRVCDVMSGACWDHQIFADRTPRAVGAGTLWVEPDLAALTVEGVGRPLRVGAPIVSGPIALRVKFPEEQAGRIEAPSLMVALEDASSSTDEVLIERPDGLFELWPLPPGGSVVNVNAGVVEMTERNGTSVLWFR